MSSLFVMRVFSILLFLLLICASGCLSVSMWCSRIIGQPTGPVKNLVFDVGKFKQAIVAINETKYPLTIDSQNKECYVNSKLFGSPCQIIGNQMNISVSNITFVKNITVVGENFTCMAFHVPECQFMTPAEGNVIVGSSFPLMKFVKGRKSVPLNFAVQGTNIGVELIKNSTARCKWLGTALFIEQGFGYFCKSVKVKMVNQRVEFNVTYTYSAPEKYVVFLWRTARSALTVALDFTVEGTSDEVADCKYEANPTTSTTVATKTSVKTTVPVPIPPQLWCSRVLGEESGRVDRMIFYAGRKGYAVATVNGTKHNITIDTKTKTCYINKIKFGAPCYVENDVMTLSVDKIQFVKEIDVVGDETTCTALHIPKCQFPTPKFGEVVPRISYPLSRFLQGSSKVAVSFAVQGSTYPGQSELLVTGRTPCKWTGSVLAPSTVNAFCKDILVSKGKDMLMFSLTYQKDAGEDADVFLFKTATSQISVAVDWSRKGVSPEVHDCDRFERTKSTTTSKGSQSGPIQMVVIGVALFLLKWA